MGRGPSQKGAASAESNASAGFLPRRFARPGCKSGQIDCEPPPDIRAQEPRQRLQLASKGHLELWQTCYTNGYAHHRMRTADQRCADAAKQIFHPILFWFFWGIFSEFDSRCASRRYGEYIFSWKQAVKVTWSAATSTAVVPYMSCTCRVGHRGCFTACFLLCSRTSTSMFIHSHIETYIYFCTKLLTGNRKLSLT